MGRLRVWTVTFIVFAVLEWVTNRARIAIMAYVGTRVVADLRSRLFRHLHTLTLNFHNNYSVGRLMSRLISDVGVLQDFISPELSLERMQLAEEAKKQAEKEKKKREDKETQEVGE